MKHALLVRLMRALERKEGAFLFLDTHAGRGSYDLSLASEGDSKAREPEWPSGIGRLWDVQDAPPEVADYLELVRAFDRKSGNLAGQPRFYPGSPRLARLVLRDRDRMELWERHPAECAALAAEFRGEKRISVHEADGYGALKACLPPGERRALTLIDAPFESKDEWDYIYAALAEGLRRLAAGTFAVWYPLSERAGAETFLESVKALKAPSLSAEMTVEPDGAGLRGSGVLIVNPPWKFEEEARRIVRYLAGKLGRGASALESVRWIVPE